MTIFSDRKNGIVVYQIAEGDLIEIPGREGNPLTVRLQRHRKGTFGSINRNSEVCHRNRTGEERDAKGTCVGNVG